MKFIFIKTIQFSFLRLTVNYINGQVVDQNSKIGYGKKGYEKLLIFL
jgi:hypothetical protein